MKKAEQSKATKEKMAFTLMQLLKTQTLESIKIRAITEACGVDRQTFYYHFADIYALLEYAVGLTLLPMLREVPEMLTIEDRLDSIIGFVADNRLALKTILDSGGRPYLYRSFYDEVSYTVHQLLGPPLKASGIPKDQIAETLRIGQTIIVSLILSWIQGYYESNAGELKTSVATLAKDYVFGVCNRPHDQSLDEPLLKAGH